MDKKLIYDITFPSNMQPERKYPVIFALHGRGSNEKEIMSLLDGVKDSFIIVGVRGPLSLGSGFEYFTIKSFGNPNIDSFDGAVNMLTDFIDGFSEKYPIDTSRQFLFGFSQGAILSMTLAIKSGNKIKGISALSGYIPKYAIETYPVKPLQDLSIFLAHGESDPIFPLETGKSNYDFFKEKTENITFRTYPTGHQVSPQEKDDFTKWFLGQ